MSFSCCVCVWQNLTAFHSPPLQTPMWSLSSPKRRYHWPWRESSFICSSPTRSILTFGPYFPLWQSTTCLQGKRLYSKCNLYFCVSHDEGDGFRDLAVILASLFRYSLWSRGDSAELRVDLLFLLQKLQEAAGGVRRGPDLMNLRRLVFSSRGTPLEEQATAYALQDTNGDSWGEGFDNTSTDLGLVLGCSQAGSGVSCRTGGVHLSHIPFLALYYR